MPVKCHAIIGGVDLADDRQHLPLGISDLLHGSPLLPWKSFPENHLVEEAPSRSGQAKVALYGVPKGVRICVIAVIRQISQIPAHVQPPAFSP